MCRFLLLYSNELTYLLTFILRISRLSEGKALTASIVFFLLAGLCHAMDCSFYHTSLTLLLFIAVPRNLLLHRIY